jgi:hypothetical protein
MAVYEVHAGTGTDFKHVSLGHRYKAFTSLIGPGFDSIVTRWG